MLWVQFVGQRRPSILEAFVLVVKKKNIKTISDGPGKPRQQDRHTMLATLKLHACTMATPTSMTCVSFLSYQGLHVHNIALAQMT